MIPLRIIHSTGLINYPDALIFMEQYVDDILSNGAPSCLWFLEHPPIITGGTSARKADIIETQDIPIYETGRGGQYTYHGPGQRIVYIMLDLRLFEKDIKIFVKKIEEWLLNTLKIIGLNTCTRDDRVGIWLPSSVNNIESKIAAIGLRVRRWVTYHGVAMNISTNLNHFQTIVPCGIKEFGVTSLQNEGINLRMQDVDTLLVDEFCKLFKMQVLHDA